MSDKKYSIIVQNLPDRRQFYFSFYMPGCFIEIHQIKNHKPWLHKSIYPDIQVQDLYLGNFLQVHDQIYRILAYSDEYTKKQLSGNTDVNQQFFRISSTFALIQPYAHQNLSLKDKLIEMCEQIGIIQKNFMIKEMRMFTMNQLTANKLCQIWLNKSGKKTTYSSKSVEDEQLSSKEYIQQKIKYLCSGSSIGMELIAPHAINKWKKITGNQNPKIAKKNNPKSLRAVYGIDIVRNSVHGSSSTQNAQKEILFFKSISLKPALKLINTTLCIIKPHIIREKRLSELLQTIVRGDFVITALELKQYSHKKINQYMQAYRFLPDYDKIVQQFEQPCVILEISSEKYEKLIIANKFKQFCGPYDPEYAKKIQQNSLRAIYGRTRIQNAVQCTDLPEDSESELRFMFQI